MTGATTTAQAAEPRRFKPYPAYKDSGIEWLGEIPAHWEVKALKHLTEFSTGWTPPTGRDDLYDGENPWANIGDLGPRILYSTEKTISDKAISEARLRIVKAGSLLFSFKLSVGTVSIAGVDMYTNEAIAAFAQSERVDTQYLYWAAPVLVPRNAQENIYGAPLLNRERIATSRLLSPSLSEQRAIAAFLDQATMRIDALVAKKERLIELLQEERTALSTGAVTKGLDPKAPMKNSGIEWLGEIPVHWEVKRLKHGTSKIGSGKTPSGGAEVYVSDGVMLLRSQNVHFGGLRLDDVAFIDPVTDAEMAGSRVDDGDVLLNITGASLGRCCVAWLDGTRANVNQHVCVIRPMVQAYDSAFLAAAISSRAVQAQIFTTENGISRDALNFEQIAELTLPQPSFEEQRTIAAFINRETARISALIAKVREAMNGLQELRTALISAAVTGKIDVREETA